MVTQALPIPPPDGWSLATFPKDAPTRAELIDGQLVWSAQTTWHMCVTRELQHALQAHAPDALRVMYRMAIKLTERTAPEPDLSLMLASAFDLDKSVLLPEEVVLVAEVVTPASKVHDRSVKPPIYAAMGIPTFWLIERGPDLAPIVHEHQLDGGAYRLMRTHIGNLKTEIPFPMEVRLNAPKL